MCFPLPHRNSVSTSSANLCFFPPFSLRFLRVENKSERDFEKGKLLFSNTKPESVPVVEKQEMWYLAPKQT